MNTIPVCRNCGASLPPDAPAGLCPQCLLKSTTPTQPRGRQAKQEPGQTLGGYRIVRLLGQGGMGAVYEAEHLESGRRVALKVLSHAPESASARQRFLREGRLAASINHPNSVYIYGTDEIDGTPIITMEFVSGGTLQDLVQRDGPMPVAAAVDAILQIIAGLEAAAAKGILHRDIKPSNCFVENDGTIKVGDFGLSISTVVRDQTSLTMTGVAMGTPAYSAPEQLRGDELDVRSDIYSVGVTLYYLLTGETPFPAQNMVNLVATVLEKPAPSPRLLRPEIPKSVALTVLKCLAKQPARRFKNYEQLRQALLPFTSTAPTPATIGLRVAANVIDSVLLVVPAILCMLFPWRMISSEIALLCFLSGVDTLYYTSLEGFWGASIGKWICGLSVVGSDRNPPGFLRALARSTVFLVTPLLPYMFQWVYCGFSQHAVDNFDRNHPFVVLAISGWSVAVYLLIFSTARRRNGFAGWHDLISGSRVIVRAAGQQRPQVTPMEDFIPPTGSVPTIGPFPILTSLACRGEEELLLGYDTRLLRKVWIIKKPLGTASLPASRRDLCRKGRLHWLGSQRSDKECWDAFEAVPGQPLVDLVQKPQPWSSVRHWLCDLVEELDAALKDGSWPEGLGMNFVWITADGRAKLLDFPAPGIEIQGAPTRDTPPPFTSSELGAHRLLTEVVHLALTGKQPGERNNHTEPRVPLPLSARRFLQTLLKAENLSPALMQIRPLLEEPAAVSRKRRLALQACSILPILASLGLILGGTMESIRESLESAPDLPALASCLSYLETREQAAKAPALKPEIVSQIRQECSAMEIYIADRFRSTITNTSTWMSGAPMIFIPVPQRLLAERAVKDHPAPTASEIRQATVTLQSFMSSLPSQSTKSMESFLAFRSVLSQANSKEVAVGFVGFAAIWAIFSLAGALLFRLGFLFRLLRIEIVTKTGLPARRWRTFLRSLLTWLPFLVLPFFLLLKLGWVAVLVMLFFVAAGAYALVHPERGLQDWLVGTWLVPK